MTVTTKARRRLATLATMLAVALMTARTETADVRVISAGAVRAIVTEMAPAYDALGSICDLEERRTSGPLVLLP